MPNKYSELAARYGTPLYVYDEQALRNNCRRYVSAFRRHYPKNTRISFAAKAFWCLAMARLVKEEGLCADVASSGELYTALKAGMPGERLYLHGNCKTPDEIEMALKNKVRRIVVDNEGELDLIEALAKKKRMRAPVLLRVTLGVEAATHTAIKTGHWDTKFGLYEKGGAAMRAAQKCLHSPYLHLHGFHAHIGSQIFHLDDYAGMVKAAFAFLAQVKEKTGFEAKELDLGGGLAVAYTEKSAPAIEEYAQALGWMVMREAKKQKLTLPELIVEPGRSIAAEAGVTLYTVRYVKKTPSGKTYAIVDGGLSDNPRPLMYGAKYQVTVSAAADQARTLVTVSGKHCETDTLFEEIRIPMPKPGDLMAVMATGAYNYSMASNYNRYPRPAVVFVKNGKSRVVVKRETLAAVCR